MLTKDLRNMVRKTTDKINPDIGNGLVVKHMQDAEKYLDEVWTVALKNCIPGLVYKGGKKATPEQEIELLTRKRMSDCSFDIAKNNMYVMRYDFEFRGQPLRPRFYQLPFFENHEAGGTWIGGSRHYVAPVMVDRVISVLNNKIFIKLLKAKNIYSREQYHYRTNIRSKPIEFVQVVWSMIYNGNGEPSPNANRNRVKANTTIAHYLFCKFGVMTTFKKFANCTPIIGQDEINEDNYPSDEWIICSTTGIRPKNVPFYRETPMRIAVKKENYTNMVRSLIAGYFYIVDRFAIRDAHVEHESTTMWQILLGVLLSNNDSSEGKLIGEMQDHISSIDSYVDGIVITQLRKIGYECTDIYDLFALVLEKIDGWINDNDQIGNSRENKEISILYYILNDITKQIFRLYFELNGIKRRTGVENITANAIEQAMSGHLRVGAIYSLNKLHGEVHTQGTSGDNKVLRPTQVLVPQHDTTKMQTNGGSDSTAIATNQFDISFSWVHSLTGMSKAKPSGETRINVCVELGPSAELVYPEEFRDLLTWTKSKMVLGKEIDETIIDDVGDD